MKYLIQLLFLIFWNSVICQNNSLEKQSDTLNHTKVKVEKKYSGGVNQFYKYIINSFRSPNVFDFPGGKEIVAFTIKTDGSVGDIKIIKDIGYGVGDQITKILKNSPKWNPAQKDGKPVDFTFTLPITIPRSDDD